MGFEKLVNELDVKEAARLGMHTRPLTTAQVQAHLQDLGIDPEFGTHSHIRGLSGETLTASQLALPVLLFLSLTSALAPACLRCQFRSDSSFKNTGSKDVPLDVMAVLHPNLVGST